MLNFIMDVNLLDNTIVKSIEACNNILQKKRSISKNISFKKTISFKKNYFFLKNVLFFLNIITRSIIDNQNPPKSAKYILILSHLGALLTVESKCFVK